MTIYDESVESVKRRGFYDNISSEHFKMPMLMAQYARLIEEIGEYEEAVRRCADAEEIANELADVVIVAAQLGHLTRCNFATWVASEHTKINGCALVQPAGEWCRYIRKGDIGGAHTALLLIMIWCRTVAAQNGISDFNAVIRAKLAADEQRGYQHNGEETA